VKVRRLARQSPKEKRRKAMKAKSRLQLPTATRLKRKRSRSHPVISQVSKSISLNVLELDRLTTVVFAIENDCQVCPVGAFKMTPDHQVRRNEAFKGLNGQDACDLSNYMHFRNVQDEQKRSDLDLPTAPFNPFFLEPLSADKPKGCWNLVQDDKKEKVILRSLMWPGFQFYHHKGSNRFGSFYNGDGLKCLELHFMI